MNSFLTNVTVDAKYQISSTFVLHFWRCEQEDIHNLLIMRPLHGFCAFFFDGPVQSCEHCRSLCSEYSPPYFLSSARITGRKHYHFHFYTNFYILGTYCYNVTPRHIWSLTSREGEWGHAEKYRKLKWIYCYLSISPLRLLSSQEWLWSIVWSFYIFQSTRLYYCIHSAVFMVP